MQIEKYSSLYLAEPARTIVDTLMYNLKTESSKQGRDGKQKIWGEIDEFGYLYLHVKAKIKKGTITTKLKVYPGEWGYAH